MLLAWSRPPEADAAQRIAIGALQAAYDRTPGEPDDRLLAGLAAAEARLRAADTRGGGQPTGRGAPRGRARSDLSLGDVLGIGAAVVDGDAVLTATRGAVDAYLIRDARIAAILPGQPSPDRARDGIARTRIRDGDTLLLASRDLLRTLGPEELRSAALTLHPAAASAHLRRLFAAHDGQGSDAVQMIDVRPSGPRRLRAEPSLAPTRRSARTTSSVPPMRRAALGLASFTSVIAIVAMLVVMLPRGEERAAAQGLAPVLALDPVTDRVTRAANVAETDPAEAVDLYRDAWQILTDAAGPDAADDPAVFALASRITTELDALRGGGVAAIRTVSELASPLASSGSGSFVRGPGGDLYVIDAVASVVTRIDTEDGDRADIIHRGDRGGDKEGRIGRPMQLERAGSTLLVMDDDARLWRWQPSDGGRDGSLSILHLGADDDWSARVGDVATYPDPNGYRVYLVDPEVGNILRFQPTFDRRSFSRSEYLVNDDESVQGFRQLHIDERVYALSDEGIRRYEYGRVQPFRLDAPPDDGDLRPGQDYRLIEGTDRSGGGGHLYLYDAAWDRFVVFDKGDGAFVRQWTAAPGDPSMGDVLAFSVTAGVRKEPDMLHWLTPTGIHEAAVAWRSVEAESGADDDRGSRESRRAARKKGRSG